MDELRSDSDAVIVGAGTVRHDGFPILVRDDDVRQGAVARGRDPHPVNVVVSRSLDIPTMRPIFRRRETRKLIFTTNAAPMSRVRRFEKFAEVVVLRRRTLSPTAVLEHLGKLGMKKVLLDLGDYLPTEVSPGVGCWRYERPLSLRTEGQLRVIAIGVGSAFSNRLGQSNFILIKGDTAVFVDLGTGGHPDGDGRR